MTMESLQQMHSDGIKRAIAFTQYPQYSCTTTGSSANELYRQIHSLGIQQGIQWSIIDRWPTHPKLVEAFVARIRDGLETYPEHERKEVVILFSAHSLPMKVVDRGDPYPQEVAATVQRVMELLHFSNPYRLCWQSKVGPLPWLGPQTKDALKGFASQGTKNILTVPIAFTSDHIETLFELDLEYGKQAKELGLTGFKRVESLNDHPIFITALAELVADHLKSNSNCTTQFLLRCPGCTNEYCKESKNFFKQQRR